MVTKTPIEINLRDRIWSAGLFARLVWQVLFDFYRKNGGDLDNLDSLLCDLKILERFFQIDTPPTEEPREPGGHLEFDFGGSVTDLKPSLPCPMLKIDWVVTSVQRGFADDIKDNKVIITYGPGVLL